MRRLAGVCRFVFNQALALQKEHHEAGNKFIGYVAMAKLLAGWRNGIDTSWLKDAPCTPFNMP
ncbi:MAG: helix-turn-helix domain-containing protein [Methyloprofundus sp.]|nr:helix-turn-helix domain-containing protein [Methyloprofundus sp.]